MQLGLPVSQVTIVYIVMDFSFSDMFEVVVVNDHSDLQHNYFYI